MTRKGRTPGTGTWAEARDASTDLLREQGELSDPATNREAAEEVASLASLLVAYSCVPAAPLVPPETSDRPEPSPVARRRSAR